MLSKDLQFAPHLMPHKEAAESWELILITTFTDVGLSMCNEVVQRLVAYQNQEKQSGQNHLFQALDVKFPSQDMFQT